MSARKRSKPHRLRKLYCRKKGSGNCQVFGIIRKQSGAGGDVLGSIGSHGMVASIFSLLKERRLKLHLNRLDPNTPKNDLTLHTRFGIVN